MTWRGVAFTTKKKFPSAYLTHRPITMPKKRRLRLIHSRRRKRRQFLLNQLDNEPDGEPDSEPDSELDNKPDSEPDTSSEDSNENILTDSSSEEKNTNTAPFLSLGSHSFTSCSLPPDDYPFDQLESDTDWEDIDQPPQVYEPQKNRTVPNFQGPYGPYFPSYTSAAFSIFLKIS